MKILRRALLLIPMLLLCSCTTLIGSHDIEYPLAKLQASLDKKFPLDNRYLELFDIQVERPVLSLHGDQRRIAISMEVNMGPIFLSKTWHGALTISAIPEIDNQQSAIVLHQIKIEQLNTDGINPQYVPQISKALNFLVEKRLNNIAVYHFKPDDLRFAGIQFTATKITPSATGLVVSFEPSK